jgi:hypothetical protein
VNDQSFILTLKHAICYGSAVTSDEVTDALRSLVAHCIAEARKSSPSYCEKTRPVFDKQGVPIGTMAGVCGKLLPCDYHDAPLAAPRESIFDTACEAYAARRKELEASASCPTCHGTGEVPDRHDPLGDTHPSKMETCEECDGHGAVEKQPSDAAKAWREKFRSAMLSDAPIARLLDEAVALITAAEQRTGMRNAVIDDLQKALNERIEDCRRIVCERDAIQRELERSHRALNESVQRERDAVKRAEAAEAMREVYCNDRDAALKRAEAAEIQRNAYRRDLLAQVHCTDAALQRAAVADSDRDDLRARLAKLLAACEAFRTEEFATDNGWSLFVQAIAEARSGATDAPQAQTKETL